MINAIIMKEYKRCGGTYNSWRAMMRRCYYIKNKDFYNYGARGISVIKRWHEFDNFMNDMGDRPKDFTLDRINNNLGYSKKNCRWIEKNKQQSNQRSNVKVKYRGVVYNVEDLIKISGINKNTFWSRLKYGWPISEIISTPPQYHLSRPKKFKHSGKVYTVTSLAKKVGVSRSAIKNRVAKGWTMQEIISRTGF